MAITTQTAIVGCVLPAAALAIVATFYFFSRRKKDDDDVAKKKDGERASSSGGADVKEKAQKTQKSEVPTPECNGTLPEVKNDVKIVKGGVTENKSGDVRKRDVIQKKEVKNDLIVKKSDAKTTKNDVIQKEEMVIPKSSATTESGKVEIEELFQSAKASIELESAAPSIKVHDDVTDGTKVTAKSQDEETMRAFMASLMTKSEEESAAWSAEEVVEEVMESEEKVELEFAVTGAGDAPTNNNITSKRPVLKKREKKPEAKKKEKKEAKKKTTDIHEKKESHEQIHERSHSDSTSEVSTDSGNGASVAERQLASPSSHTLTCMQFEFPSRLCGKFVGKSGRNINQIKNASGCQITLLQHPYYNPEYQICTLDGTEDEVSQALSLIKEKFPTSRYSDITYLPFPTPHQEAHPVISPDFMELRLIDGIYNDVVVSSVVDASQIFVQQPAHPTFPSLESLNINMNACYNQDPSAPPLPTPIEPGVICAAPVLGGWYRAQILDWHDGQTEVDVKYVDYGGYSRARIDTLKQIRSDFMTIPFQACECYLANIAPLEGETGISLEASAVLEELTQGSVLQCEIVQYDEVTKVPYIYLYKINGTQTVFVNRELVDRSVVRWIE